ncbi:hypothetical protein JOF53_006571 [Crossiella equi]|uniref:Uncharacterized protein n=1 Tax=Crossiella equi TaxID=130796 RepID=A0ABS5AND2_9PSEU|nr:hypothetical protein [Crossiella equi]MBP2477699.1 hypothetical protein [Crossiella equi]
MIEELAACITRDLSRLGELAHVVRSAQALRQRLVDAPERARQPVEHLHAAASTVCQRARMYARTLNEMRRSLARPGLTAALADFVVRFHQHLHGEQRHHDYEDKTFGALADLAESTENLVLAVAAKVRKHRVGFEQDEQMLRGWVQLEPDVRAPDRLVPVPGSSVDYLVLAHPRPYPASTPEQEWETVTVEQLSSLHWAMVRGHSLTAASAGAGVGEYEAVAAAVRCGRWLRQVLGAVQPPQRRPRFGHSTVSATWSCTGRTGAEVGDMWLFACHYTPERGAWYQIIHGDVPDLRGLMPMSAADYRALIEHAADGGVLSDFALASARRYREVLAAWDNLVETGKYLQVTESRVLALLHQMARERQALPPHRLAEVVEQVRDGLFALGYNVSAELSHAYGQVSQESPPAVDALRRLRADFSRLHRHLRHIPVVASPSGWGRREIAVFQQRLDDDRPTDDLARQKAVHTIRTEIRRLLARRLVVESSTERGLLITVHRELSRAVRESRVPVLPPPWRLWMAPGCPQEHVWRAFQVWPDIVVQAETPR